MTAKRLCLLSVVLATLLGLSACRRDPTPEQPPVGGDTNASDSVSSASTSQGLPDGWQALALGLTRAALPGLADVHGATEYVIDLNLSDDLRRVEGQQTVRYTNRETVTLEEVYFRLYPVLVGGDLRLLSATVDGQTVDPIYEFEGSAARLALPSPLAPGESVEVALDFAVDVPGPSESIYGVLGYSADILSLAHAYPMIPVYDDEGWNLEVPPPHGDVVYADASFYRVSVTAPEAVVIAAAGVQVERDLEDGGQRVTYVSGPARDFYLAASERFEVVERTVNGTTLRSYAPAEFAEASERALTYAGHALEVFAETLGEYPYTELDLVAADFAALGVEYPGILMLEIAFYDPADDSLPSDWFESVVAHEVGHLWFYNSVGNDQLDEPWLDESLTQYMTMVYFGQVHGPPGYAGFHQALEGRWDRVERAEIPIGLPARDYQGPEYSAIVYGRGAFFFEALNERMGAAAFDTFLREYYETHLWGIGTSESFRSLAERQCACSLQALFEDWVYPR